MKPTLSLIHRIWLEEEQQIRLLTDGLEAAHAYIAHSNFRKLLRELVDHNPSINSFNVETPYVTLRNLSLAGMHAIIRNDSGFYNWDTKGAYTAIPHLQHILSALQKLLLTPPITEQVYGSVPDHP
jgi:hypothetical protein